MIESSDDRRSIDIFAKARRARRGGQRRRGQGGRPLEEARPLRRAPGRLRQPLHLRAPRRGLEVLPGAQGATRTADSRRTAAAVKANGEDDADPQAAPARLGRPPDRRLRHGARARPRRRHRVARRHAGVGAGQAAPVRAPRHARARARPAASSSSSTRWRARAASSRPTRTSSRGPFGLDPSKVRLRALQEGLAGDRRHDHRPRRPDRPRQGRPPRLLDPPGGPRRPEDRSRSRSSTAGSCSRPPPSTAPRAATSSTATTRPAAMSIGQILLLPKPLLEKRVLSDERIDIYECGRDDIRSGQIDRRVLATLAYLAESGPQADGHVAQVRPRLLHELGQRLAPLLRQRRRHRADQRHPDPRPPGAGRHHRAGRAPADAAPGHDGPRPDHLAARDRRRDLRDGRPRRPHPRRASSRCSAPNRKLGKQALAVLEPGQWSDLISRLGEIENPVVPTKPSKYALPVEKKERARATPTRASSATAAARAGSTLRLRPARVRLPARARPTGATWCAARPDGPVEAVLVLGTLGAPERRWLRDRRPRERGARPRPSRCRPRRATVVRPEPFASAEADAAAWLDELRRDAELARRSSTARARVLNRALRAQRAAAADPYVGDVSAERALVVRLGYGSGDARGRRPVRRGARAAQRPARAGSGARWRRPRSASRRSSAAARRSLAAEELVLRARADLDAGRAARGGPPGARGDRGAARARPTRRRARAEQPRRRWSRRRPRRRSTASRPRASRRPSRAMEAVLRRRRLRRLS